ncbi:glycoside hydrolase family 61 protein F [Armillaria mellea]|nr:glycoside hydrolase family 61 protein F [Armillaria mellea]
MFKAALVASLLASIASVHGHGYVETIVADGTEYSGYLPYSDPYYNPVPDRIVRPIPGNGPVEDLTLIDLQCNGYTAGGYYTAPAPIYGTVTAGSKVALNWTTWPDSHKGPIITYMARVPDNINITAWSPGTSAVWFKVAESGKTSAGLWAATDLLTASNSVYTFTIPSSLKAGQYIIRHEIIALHGAFSYPGAQFYPSCIQVQVTGSGNAYPTSFVSFPGAYTASTPGIVFDIYTDTSLAYPIPGPAVWTG